MKCYVVFYGQFIIIDQMLKIGLTGGIGSGKSIVAAIFQVLGIPVFDADKEAKCIMENNPRLVAAIKKLFGNDSYIDTKLNRPFIAKIVFNNAAKLLQLNALVHPATIAAAEVWMNSQKSPYVVKEAALMFESASTANMDYIIGVSAPYNIRLQRAMSRDNIGEQEIVSRMERQMDEAVKMNLCNFVIVNDGLRLIVPQVLELHEKFMKM